ncbi:septum formation initiator family protein [Erysipelotrichaceae bacterium HCN-30851]
MSKERKSNVKRTKRKKHPLKLLISLIVIGVSGYLFYEASKDVVVMFNLKQEISANNSEIEELTEEKEKLSTQKKKLEDPEYVKRYARDKYLASKDGEQVFKLPGGKSEDTEE